MVSLPKPIAFRTDSLLVKVTLGALIYFVPQDLALLGLGAAAGRAKSRNTNAPVALDDPKKGLDNYLKSRGITQEKVNVKEGRSQWEVKLKSVYQ